MSGGHGGFEEEEAVHENEERWLLTYADMMTLLVAFFIMMYSMSVLNMAKFQQLAVSVKSGFTGDMEAKKGDTMMGDSKSMTIDPIVISKPGGEKGGKVNRALGEDPSDTIFADLKQQMIDLQISKKLQGIIDIKEKEGNLYIVIITDKIFFLPGKAELTEEAKVILGDIGGMIKPLRNEITVEGYTSITPPADEGFRNNWELSAGRSISVIEFFQDVTLVEPERLSLTGYGEYRPLFNKNTASADNDRVVIAVMKKTFKGEK